VHAIIEGLLDRHESVSSQNVESRQIQSKIPTSCITHHRWSRLRLSISHPPDYASDVLRHAYHTLPSSHQPLYAHRMQVPLFPQTTLAESHLQRPLILLFHAGPVLWFHVPNHPLHRTRLVQPTTSSLQPKIGNT
jgi:hypothetical protein